MGWYLPREVLLNFLNVSLAYGDICGGVAPVVIDDRDFGDGARYKDKEGVEDIENDVVIDMDLAVLQELGVMTLRLFKYRPNWYKYLGLMSQTCWVSIISQKGVWLAYMASISWVMAWNCASV